MNMKEYLSQAIWLDRIINNKLEQLDSLKCLAEKVTTSYSQEKVSATKSRSPLENAVVKIIDLEHEIDEDIDRFVDLKREISEVIGHVRSLNQRLLLEMRYIGGKSWDDVALELNYNSRTVFKVHGKALKEIERIIKEGSKGQ